MASAEKPDYLKQLLAYRDGFLVSKTLFAACEVGVFDALLESAVPLSSVAVAQRLNASADGISRLLDGCVGLKLLTKVKDNNEALYKNTEMSAAYLTQSSPKSLLPMMAYYSQIKYRYFDYLTDAVREGKTQHERAFGSFSEDIYDAVYRSEDEMLKFMRYMDSSWVNCGRAVITAFDLSPFPTVCDIGGNSGALAKQCILANPNSTVTIYDLPKVVETAKKYFIALDEGRVTFTEGDFFEDPIPEADLYILARIMHDWEEHKCLKLLTKVYNSCKPGGGILLVEAFLNEDHDECLQSQLFSLNMLLQAEGKSRSLPEYTSLLSAAGFGDVQFRATGVFCDALLARK